MKITAGASYLAKNPKFPELIFTFYIIGGFVSDLGDQFYVGVKQSGGAVMAGDYTLFWFNKNGESDWHEGQESCDEKYLNYRLIAKSRAKRPEICREL